MPYYMGQAVSDEDLQALVEAYRDGQRLQGGEGAVEDSDGPVISRLEELQVDIKRRGVSGAHGFKDAAGKGVEE